MAAVAVLLQASKIVTALLEEAEMMMALLEAATMGLDLVTEAAEMVTEAAEMVTEAVEDEEEGMVVILVHQHCFPIYLWSIVVLHYIVLISYHWLLRWNVPVQKHWYPLEL